MPKNPNLAVALRRNERRPQPIQASENGKGKKLVIFRLDPEVVYQLKSLALREGKPLQSLLSEGVNEVFAKRDMPAIAK